ncbi:hypothetical protein [Micromonospora sp. NPDC050200]
METTGAARVPAVTAAGVSLLVFPFPVRGPLLAAAALTGGVR